MPPRFRLLAPFAVALLAACDATECCPPPPRPRPVLEELIPETIAQGSGAQAIVLAGSGFIEQSVVRVGGSTRPTTRESATRLVANLTAEDVATARTLPVSVSNTPPAGDTSSALLLVVIVASTEAPVLAGVSPSSIQVPAADPRITLGGQHFGGASQVVLSTATSGPIRPATFFITTDALRFRISDAAIAPHLPQAAGQSVTFQVRVDTPGIGTSQPLTLVVTR